MSGILCASSVAFSAGGSGTTVDFVFALNSGTAGNLVDTTSMDAASHGAAGFWREATRPVEHTRVAVTTTTFPNPVVCGGVQYTGATRTVKFDLTEGAANNSTPIFDRLDRVFDSASLAEFSVTMLVKPSISGGDSDMGFIGLAGGGSFTVHTRSNVSYFLTESVDSESATIFSANGGPFTSGEVATCCFKRSNADSIVTVLALAADGTLLGVIRKFSEPSTSTFFSLSDYIVPVAGSFEIGAIAIGLGANADFPLAVSLVIPDPTGVSAEVGEGKMVVQWTGIGLSFKVERKVNGGSWATVDSDFGIDPDYTVTGGPTSPDAFQYDDSDVTDASTYQYRITGKVDAVLSGAVTTDVVTYEDPSETLLVDEPFEGTGTPSGWSSFGFGAIDYHSTSSPLSGSKSLQIDGTGSSVGIIIPVADAGPALYWKFMLRVDTVPGASFPQIFFLADVSDNIVLNVLLVSATGTLVVADLSGLVNVATVEPMSAGANFVWLKYQPATSGANGIVRIWHAPTDSKPADGSDFSAGGNTASGTTLVTYASIRSNSGAFTYDNLQASNAVL
jgi:hypothetical protein